MLINASLFADSTSLQAYLLYNGGEFDLKISSCSPSLSMEGPRDYFQVVMHGITSMLLPAAQNNVHTLIHSRMLTMQGVQSCHITNSFQVPILLLGKLVQLCDLQVHR